MCLPLLMPPYSLSYSCITVQREGNDVKYEIFFISFNNLRPTASISKELYTHEIEMKWNKFIKLVEWVNSRDQSPIRLLGPQFDRDRSPIRQLRFPIRQLSVLIREIGTYSVGPQFVSSGTYSGLRSLAYAVICWRSWGSKKWNCSFVTVTK